jgi:hypothetical protein
MVAYGQVTITVNDGGSGTVITPATSVQVVMGCSSIGTAAQPVATRSLTTLTSTFGTGPLVEAAALTILAGGTVIAVKTAQNSAGTRKAVQFTGTGSSVITSSGNPNDDYFIVFKVVTGGTIGVTGITYQVSLDAGRTFGPILALGTANTYLIPSTGVTLNFAAGTLVAADKAQFQTTQPLWGTAGVQSALNALAASVYGTTGWGSMHLVGGSTTGGVPGADCSTIAGYLESFAGSPNFIYTDLFMSARDLNAPATWGGAGETEAAWMSAIQTDYAAVAAKRACVGAGYWNMPSPFANVGAWGAPRYRRPMTWAAAARQVTIPVQRMLSRVKDGSLSQIVVDPTNDPLDGFVYHDERSNPGLSYLAAGGSGSRFMSTWTRPKQSGAFATQPLTFAQLGSDFYLRPRMAVMNVACGIAQFIGQQQIDDEVRLNTNGTVNTNDASNVQSAISAAINNALLSTAALSPPGCKVIVDTTANVGSTGIVPINVTIYGVGYILAETIGIQYSNPNVGS